MEMVSPLVVSNTPGVYITSAPFALFLIPSISETFLEVSPVQKGVRASVQVNVTNEGNRRGQHN